MVKIMENPIKMDDLGENPLFSETSIYYKYIYIFQTTTQPWYPAMVMLTTLVICLPVIDPTIFFLSMEWNLVPLIGGR